MTKKDFFRLIIKIFGLFCIISTIFSTLPHNILWVIREIDITGVIWIFTTVILVVYLFILLIYKTDVIISWLKLDRGFDNENIDFQDFNSENILKLGIIIIGGIFLLKNIPTFLTYTLFAFKSPFQHEFTDNLIKYTNPRDYIYWISSFLNIVIGYLMLTNYTYISRILKKKDDKNEKIRAGEL